MYYEHIKEVNPTTVKTHKHPLLSDIIGILSVVVILITILAI